VVININNNFKYAALFCRNDSAYKKRHSWDVYDAARDATKYEGHLPIVCHPPCRAWGRLSHMANPKPGEKDLALWALDRVRMVGGILEHPSGSRLWDQLPSVGSDEYGGFVIEIDQYDFGHVAHKKTKLYICGVERKDLPALPEKDNTIHLCEKGKRRSICGNVKGTTRCTQYQREYTPESLIDWFELVLELIHDRYRLLHAMFVQPNINNK